MAAGGGGGRREITMVGLWLLQEEEDCGGLVAGSGGRKLECVPWVVNWQ